MKSSVKLRPTPWDLIVFAAVAAAAVALGCFFWQQAAASGDDLTAVISQNGTVLETVRLSTIAEGERQEFTVSGDYTAVVALERDRVCIESSTCPSQDCVHTGWISRPGQSVVCLPNRLVVELTGSSSGGAASSAVDVVIG
jgi:Uncharacterized protein conserved in bacteria